MKVVFIDNPLFRILCPPIYGVLIYLLVLMANDNISQIEENFFSQEVWVLIGLTFFLSEGMRLVIRWLNRVYPAEKRLQSRIAIQLALNSLYSVCLISSVIAAYFVWIVGFSTFRVELVTINIIFLISAFLYNLLYIGFLYLNIQNTAKLEKENVKTKNLEFQLLSFKNEVNPDFLYASLETLIPLLHKNAGASEKYIDKLSEVYRYLLDNKQNEFNNLDCELEAVDNLIYLFNEKYNGCITITASLEVEDRQKMIVTGTLARLVEFIVESTLINQNQPLTLKSYIDQDREYLVLQHKINERLIKPPHLAKSFEDVQRTYTFFTDKPVMEVKAYGDSFLKIPLIDYHEEPVTA